MNTQKKIIAALSTAPGVAGVSMIRVSGFESISLVDRCFKGQKTLSSRNSHEIAYGKFIDPQNNQIVDEVMIGVFAHGRSFTGEESLEIWTHGSPYIVKEVLRILSILGVAPAEPGEFSLRAFLNGKIDLTQAEAIKDLTEAQTKFAHIQALGRLEGKLSQKINIIHSKILDILSLIEMSIDHAEEEFDTQDLSPRYLLLIDEIVDELSYMISGAKVGKMSTDGIKIALVGKPNAGKSSLLNALVQENRVIVSDIAGTTRDVIEHRISARGLLMRFFDTAGLRETEDLIEQEGVKRSLIAIEESDIVIHVVDQSVPIDHKDQEFIKLLSQQQKYTITIFNKKDLLCVIDKKEIAEEFIEISASLEEGIDHILDAIAEYYFSGGVDPQQEIFAANVRQENLLLQASESLNLAKNTITCGESEEFTASHVRKARKFLEEIVGKTTDDAILDRIFSQFCIGK